MSGKATALVRNLNIKSFNKLSALIIIS